MTEICMMGNDNNEDFTPQALLCQIVVKAVEAEEVAEEVVQLFLYIVMCVVFALV